MDNLLVTNAILLSCANIIRQDNTTQQLALQFFKSASATVIIRIFDTPKCGADGTQDISQQMTKP